MAYQLKNATYSSNKKHLGVVAAHDEGDAGRLARSWKRKGRENRRSALRSAFINRWRTSVNWFQHNLTFIS
jgi:hypothetical protein